MRIIGLDFGDKTIGVAVSDELLLTAQGVEVIRRSDAASLKSSVARLKEIIALYGAETVVLGFPKNMNNTEGPRCQTTLAFKKRLERDVPEVIVVLQDERLSTAEADRTLIEGGFSRLKRGRTVDKIAAALILQTYLDTRRLTVKAAGLRRAVVKKRGKTIRIEESDIKKPDDGNLNENVPNDRDKDNDFDWESSTITIKDEDGDETEFYILDELTHNGANYLLVVEADMIEDDETEAIIFKETGEEGEDLIYDDELEDEEFEAVAKLFDQRLEDYDIEF